MQKLGENAVLRKDIEWTKVFAGIKRMREIKLRWFQTKICYRILVPNSILNVMGVNSQSMRFSPDRKRHNFSLYVPT